MSWGSELPEVQHRLGFQFTGDNSNRNNGRYMHQVSSSDFLYCAQPNRGTLPMEPPTSPQISSALPMDTTRHLPPRNVQKSADLRTLKRMG